MPGLPKDIKVYSPGTGNHGGKDSLVSLATIVNREMTSSAGGPLYVKKEDTKNKREFFKGEDFSYLAILT